ncbi:AzlD domain-containing protein [Cryobacterium sp. Y82]|uniref:AzlD domain-containing protein n=1 Tax=Cryobacterium sp. Y82 TaxID=2045017 RepID=UPI000CE5616A|nr:AzlD domain-containing protein [Cryobacterium sp. Y82]
MTVWQIIILASIAVLALKLAGYLVPPALLQRPTPSRIADLLTVALLAALIAVQTLGSGQALTVDARIPAVIVAAGLFAIKTPFIVVVLVAALVAAGLRALT